MKMESPLEVLSRAASIVQKEDKSPERRDSGEYILQRFTFDFQHGFFDIFQSSCE